MSAFKWHAPIKKRMSGEKTDIKFEQTPYLSAIKCLITNLPSCHFREVVLIHKFNQARKRKCGTHYGGPNKAHPMSRSSSIENTMGGTCVPGIPAAKVAHSASLASTPGMS